ncbi:MAG: carbohydrate ABC transporter permease, partial [Bacillota bacterium]
MRKNATIPQHLIAVFLLLVFLFPVLYIIFSAFKPNSELFSSSFSFFPRNWTLDNFREAWQSGNFSRNIFNSFLVAVSSTFIAVLINTMSGYALAKFRFKGDTFILLLILSTIMLPLEIIMVPIFSVLRFLGLYDSMWALIVPPAA